MGRRRRSNTSIARPAKSRPTNLPALTYLGHEWMTAGIIPVARGAEGEWLMLAAIETKEGVATLTPFKGKRTAGENMPIETALREFNCKANGAARSR